LHKKALDILGKVLYYKQAVAQTTKNKNKKKIEKI